MKVLAIDTSSDVAIVAITHDGRVMVERAERVGTRHAETVLGGIESALAVAGIGIGEIELVAIGLGPGSFTGVRIGVATAKGLALARGTPIVGVRTTRAIARGAFGAIRVPVVDGHKGEVFAAVYEEAGAGLVSVMDEAHGKPEDIGARVRAVVGARGITVCGSGARMYRERLLGAIGEPFVVGAEALDVARGAMIAIEAEERFASGGGDDVERIEPVYLRAADAMLPGEKRRG